MRVTIWSHFSDTSWTGDVPDELLDDRVVNEALFYLFNRIDEASEQRLEAWGYRLPSLSVDDTVTWGGKTYRVADVGFEEVTA